MRTAAFTIAQDETRFLSAWAAWHGRYFDDLYVLDHNSRGDSIEVLGDLAVPHHVCRLHHPRSYDERYLTSVTCKFQQFLLCDYAAVFFSAADELVAFPDEGYAERFAAGESPRAVVAAGYEVVHDREHEPAIDFDAALLRQRKWWYPCRRYTKPVLANHSVFWRPGWHRASNVPDRDFDEAGEVRLIHLHRIDYDYCLARHRAKAAREWDPESRNEGVFRHNRVEDPDQLDRWLRCNADDTGSFAELQEIPDEFKELF